MALIIGIDDAGRGPLIGPMVLTGVLLTKEQEDFLKKEGVKDSKMLPHKDRIRLSGIILKNSLKAKIVLSHPAEIDHHVESKINLNTLEAKKAAEIINNLNDTKSKIKVIVDCPSTNCAAWRKTLISFIKHPNNLEIQCEHKADVNYPCVSAASILAKVEREIELDKIKKIHNHYGDIGSGYSHDPITIEFFKKHSHKLKNSGIFRKSWSTWKKLYPEKGKKQASLSEF